MFLKESFCKISYYLDIFIKFHLLVTKITWFEFFTRCIVKKEVILSIATSIRLSENIIACHETRPSFYIYIAQIIC